MFFLGHRSCNRTSFQGCFFFQVILGGPEQLQLSLILMDHIKKWLKVNLKITINHFFISIPVQVPQIPVM